VKTGRRTGPGLTTGRDHLTRCQALSYTPEIATSTLTDADLSRDVYRRGYARPVTFAYRCSRDPS
jgi:hypothetical protein